MKADLTFEAALFILTEFNVICSHDLRHNENSILNFTQFFNLVEIFVLEIYLLAQFLTATVLIHAGTNTFNNTDVDRQIM